MSSSVDIFSFFSGLGFLDHGFESLNFEIKLVNEIHKPFIDAYKISRHNMGIDVESNTYFSCEDVSVYFDPKSNNFLKSLINKSNASGHLVGFIGGPPCPDFSVGGKNIGFKGENGRLSRTYSELIYSSEPNFFVFENVKGLFRTKKHREFYETVKQKLSKKYYIFDKLINSIEYGAPQDRDRILMIGFRRDFIEATNKDKIENLVDWDFFKLFPGLSAFEFNWPDTDKFIEGSLRLAPANIPKELTVQYWFEKNNVEVHFNQQHHFRPRNGLARFLSVPEGDDSKKSFKRLHRWRYSPTACYGNNEVHLHPYKARRISVAEALAIQTLPKDFVLPKEMSLTNMFKGIGNGVPYLMAKGIANTILKSLSKL